MGEPGTYGGEQRACCGARHRRGGAGRGALAEPAVLAALLKSGGHGYDLRRTIAELSGEEIDVDQGGLYRILRRMEEEGFVRSAWSEGDAGPQRREYELTPQAHGLAKDWITHLREREHLASMLANMLEEALAVSDQPVEAEEAS